ncbi:MAG: hypothetical protein JWO88_3617 [Frankiales bacterium]|nr:hypothetical protein [Frankiales bacterium]
MTAVTGGLARAKIGYDEAAADGSVDRAPDVGGMGGSCAPRLIILAQANAL